MAKVYEIRDVTDEQYFSLGIYLIKEAAVAEVEMRAGFDAPISDTVDQDEEVIAIVEMTTGWGKREKEILRISRGRIYVDELEESDEWKTVMRKINK